MKTLTRSFLALAILAALGLLASCGSSGGQTPVGVQIAISLSANTTNINQGGSSNITATVTGDTSNAGVTWTQSGPTGGSLTNVTTTSVTYNAPAKVSGTPQASITATSKANTSVSASILISITGTGGTSNNVAQLVVDGGLFPTTQPYPNGVFASATICEPGSTTACTTIDHLLVDTGSFGVRILQSQLGSVALNPITLNGQTLNNCILFGDGSFLWGEVAPADVSIGGEKASSLPIQVVADPPGGSTNIPSGCSGNDQDSQSALLTNGILGVGPEPTDCIYAGVDFCDGSNGGLVQGVYFWCSGPPNCTTGVTPTPASQQVTNPVVAFATDNNGTVINFPSDPPQPQTTGTITFGIGTQSNNALGTATVYTATASANNGWVFSTTYSGLGLYLPYSFIDSGSNAYYLQNPGGNLITVCSDNPSFFCPASNLVNQTATNTGANNASGDVSFEIDNADNLANQYSGDFNLATLAGPFSTFTDSCPSGNSDPNCGFDWGMPFFYGRTVFTSIDLTTVTGQPAPPWWAY